MVSGLTGLTGLGHPSPERERGHGLHERGPGHVISETELRLRSVAELDESDPSPLRSDLKGAGCGRDQGLDVFEVGPAHAERTVDEKDQVCRRTRRAFWEKNTKERNI